MLSKQGKFWLSRTWYEVVGSGDIKHLLAGTRVEPTFSFKHAMFYVSKYVAKYEKGGEKQVFEYPIGRYWGVWHKEKLHIEKVVFEVTREQMVRLRRYFNRWLKSQKSSYRLNTFGFSGFSIFAPSGMILRLLSFVLSYDDACAQYDFNTS